MDTAQLPSRFSCDAKQGIGCSLISGLVVQAGACGP